MDVMNLYTLEQIIQIPSIIFDNSTIKEIMKKIQTEINKKLKNKKNLSLKDITEDNIIIEEDEDEGEVKVSFKKTDQDPEPNMDDISDRWDRMKKKIQDINVKKNIGPEDDRSKYTFYLKDEMGSGNYGTVFKGINNRTNEEVAIKLKKNKGAVDTELSEYKDEVNCLKKIVKICKKVGILCYEDSFSINGYHMIVTPYLNKYQSLMKFIKTKDLKLTVSEAKYISQQMYDVLFTLKEIGLGHGDFHDENIMIDPNNLKIVVIDLGNCMNLSDLYSDELTEDGFNQADWDYFEIIKSQLTSLIK
jgi:RIO-like serine/threonine protein kinase